MCEGNCKCKDKEIKTVYVDMDWGEQMMFAVPPDMRNVTDSVSVVDEIRDEILGMVDYKLSLHQRHGFSVEQVCESIKDDIKNIFNKYSK